MVTAWGVDYAWSHPSPAALKAAGKTFACRYIGTNIDDSKMLTASELSALRANGVDVVANVEGSAGGFRGYAAGQRWASNGVAWLNSRGLKMPAGRPIYFSADWDVQPGDWPDLKAALDGAASVIGRSCVGLYGGLYAIQKAQATGAATWFWQTYGWSLRKQPDGTYRTVWADGTHIQQYRNGVSLSGADCDLNRAMQADFGQWGFQGDNMDEQSIISALYADLARNPGTTDPNGQSGLNRLFRQFAREECAMDIAPVKTGLDALKTELDDIKQVIATLAGQPAVQVTQEELNAAVYAALKQLAAGAA